MCLFWQSYLSIKILNSSSALWTTPHKLLITSLVNELHDVFHLWLFYGYMGVMTLALWKSLFSICFILSIQGCGGDHILIFKILCRRKWQPTTVFLPGESHEQRSLEGYSPWAAKRQAWLSDCVCTSNVNYPQIFHLHEYLSMYGYN